MLGGTSPRPCRSAPHTLALGWRSTVRYGGKLYMVGGERSGVPANLVRTAGLAVHDHPGPGSQRRAERPPLQRRRLQRPGVLPGQGLLTPTGPAGPLIDSPAASCYNIGWPGRAGWTANPESRQAYRPGHLVLEPAQYGPQDRRVAARRGRSRRRPPRPPAGLQESHTGYWGASLEPGIQAIDKQPCPVLQHPSAEHTKKPRARPPRHRRRNPDAL